MTLKTSLWVVYLVNVNPHTKFEVPITRPKDMMGGSKFENGSHDPYLAHLRVVFILQLKLDIAYLRTKFDDYSFSGSRDMIGTPKFKMGHVITILPV